MIVGRLSGVCAGRCIYDDEGVCVHCNALDGYEWIVYRLPTKETAEREALRADFAEVAARHGLDLSILQLRRL